MTTGQRKAYKEANKRRKSALIEKVKDAVPQLKGYWANFGLIQD